MEEKRDVSAIFRKNTNQEYDRAIEELLQRQIRSIEVFVKEE
jgi:hypothetical protein